MPDPTSIMREPPILIIGGGIGGLTLALALGQQNIPCLLLEQRETFSEIGAGLQLSPNAVRRLDELGLMTQLKIAASAPEGVTIRDGVRGVPLVRLPLGALAKTRYGAPYLVIARRDLQAILLEAVGKCSEVELITGQKFVSYNQTAQRIEAEMADGATYQGRLLIGADGIWSRVRQMIAPEAHPKLSGMIAWRAMLRSDDAPCLFCRDETQVWLGPHTHLVAYRVSGGDEINLVAVCRGQAKQRSWEEALPPEILFEAMRPLAEDVRGASMEIQNWRAWPLMNFACFHPWQKGRLCVMGDAAHAVVPFLAQGAALAIEDAILLAQMIVREGAAPMRALPAFEAARFNRCRKVAARSQWNGRIYHAGPALRPFRNFLLKATPGKTLLGQHDWIYKY